MNTIHVKIKIKIIFKRRIWRTFRENLCSIFDTVVKKVLQVKVQRDHWNSFPNFADIWNKQHENQSSWKAMGFDHKANVTSAISWLITALHSTLCPSLWYRITSTLRVLNSLSNFMVVNKNIKLISRRQARTTPFYPLWYTPTAYAAAPKRRFSPDRVD